MRIAVVPTYQPGEIFPEVIKQMTEAGFRVLVVDDGSGSKYAEQFDAVREYATVIGYPAHQGIGHALKAGFRYLLAFEKESSTVVMMDADGQYRIKDALKVCKCAEKYPHSLAIGSRVWTDGTPMKHRIGNLTSMVTYKIATGHMIRDNQSGLRACDTSLMEKLIEIPGSRYEYLMNMLMYLQKDACRVVQVPVETVYEDGHADRHFHSVKDNFLVQKEIVQFGWKEIRENR